MKIVVIGGTGLIGTKVVALLRAGGQQALAAAPNTGVDTITGEGLAAALSGAEAVVDLANSGADPVAAMRFFKAHEANLLAAEKQAGVGLHVVLSIVGADRSPDNGYFQAKLAQEDLIKASGVPYTILRSTQFMESIASIAEGSQTDGVVSIATGLFQPIAADDVAAFVADAATGAPRNGTIEIAGPERAPFDEIVRRRLQATGDRRPVRADPDAPYYGAKVEQLSLVPTGEARLGRITLDEWLRRKQASAAGAVSEHRKRA